MTKKRKNITFYEFLFLGACLFFISCGNSSISFDGDLESSQIEGLSALSEVNSPVTFEGTKIPEGTDGNITISLVESYTVPVSLDFSIQEDSGAYPATPDTEFETIDQGKINFAQGEISKVVTVTTYDDTLAEPLETIKLILSNPQGFTFPEGVTTIEKTLTIEDNDTLSISDVSPKVLKELDLNDPSNETRNVTVTISQKYHEDVVILVSLQKDPNNPESQAEEPYDYLPLEKSTLLIKQGEQSGTLPITIRNDFEFEGNESFILNLSKPYTLHEALSMPSGSTNQQETLSKIVIEDDDLNLRVIERITLTKEITDQDHFYSLISGKIYKTGGSLENPQIYDLGEIQVDQLVGIDSGNIYFKSGSIFQSMNLTTTQINSLDENNLVLKTLQYQSRDDSVSIGQKIYYVNQESLESFHTISGSTETVDTGDVIGISQLTAVNDQYLFFTGMHPVKGMEIHSLCVGSLCSTSQMTTYDINTASVSWSLSSCSNNDETLFVQVGDSQSEIDTKKTSCININAQWLWNAEPPICSNEDTSITSAAKCTYHIWRSEHCKGEIERDGVLRTISQCSDENATASSYPESLTVVGSKIYFTARNSDSQDPGHWLYVIDPTSYDSTPKSLVKSSSSNENHYWAYDSNLGKATCKRKQTILTNTISTLNLTINKFHDTDYSQWGSTGHINEDTNQATNWGQKSDLIDGLSQDREKILCEKQPYHLTAAGTNLYFVLEDGNENKKGAELWITNGVTTTLVKNIVDDTNSSCYKPKEESQLTEINGVNIFLATTCQEEFEKSSGSQGNGVIPMGSLPSQLTYLNEKLYFSAYHPNYGRELWVTDSSPEGTKLLRDLKTREISNTANLNPQEVFSFKDSLYFKGTADVPVIFKPTGRCLSPEGNSQDRCDEWEQGMCYAPAKSEKNCSQFRTKDVYGNLNENPDDYKNTQWVEGRCQWPIIGQNTCKLQTIHGFFKYTP